MRWDKSYGGLGCKVGQSYGNLFWIRSIVVVNFISKEYPLGSLLWNMTLRN